MLPSIQLVVSWCAVWLAGGEGQLWAGFPLVKPQGVLHRTGPHTWTELLSDGKYKIHVKHPLVPSLLVPPVTTIIKPWSPKDEANFWKSLALKQLYKTNKESGEQSGPQEQAFKKPSQTGKSKAKKYRPEKLNYNKEEYQKEPPRELSKHNEYSTALDDYEKDQERELDEEYSPREQNNDYGSHASGDEYRSHPSGGKYRSHPPSDEYSSHSASEEYSSDPPSEEYRSHPPSEEYKSHSSSDEYRSHSPTDDYRSHSPTDDYRSHPSTDDYRSHPSTDDYRSYSSSKQHRSHPTSDEYRSHPTSDEYRSHPPVDEYRSHPTSDEYRSHPPVDEYRYRQPSDEYGSYPARDEFKSTQDSKDEHKPSHNYKHNGQNIYYSRPQGSRSEFEEGDSHANYKESNEEYDKNRIHKPNVSKWKPITPHYKSETSWRDDTPHPDDQFSAWKDEHSFWGLKEEPSKKIENAESPVHHVKTTALEAKYTIPAKGEPMKIKGPRSVYHEHQDQPIVEVSMWTGEHVKPLWKPDNELKFQDIPQYSNPGYGHGVHSKEPAEKPVEYEFQYSVNSPKTGDVKSHKEMRKGDKVVGRYTTAESDGTTRVVEYTSDKHTGFVAVVENHGKKSEQHKPAQAVGEKIQWSPKEQDQRSWHPTEVWNNAEQRTNPHAAVEQHHFEQPYQPQVYHVIHEQSPDEHSQAAHHSSEPRPRLAKSHQSVSLSSVPGGPHSFRVMHSY